MGLSCLDGEDGTPRLAVFPLHPAMSSNLEDERPQVLGEVGLLIQGRKQLDVALKGDFPQDVRFLTDYIVFVVIQACTPRHRISSAEGTPDSSTSSWSDHSIRGKLSHLVTSGSGWATE